jgi:hypothetical protein
MPGATRRLAFRRLAPLLVLSSIALGVPAATAAAVPARLHVTFATPSSIAAVGKWIVVTNKATSTLSVLSAATGSLEAMVSHHDLGVSAPNSAVASTTSGRSLVLVAGIGGSVAELNVATSAASRPAVTRLRILKPTGCAKTATAYLTVDAHGHVLEACSTGVVSEWAVRMGGLVRRFPAVKTRVTNATGLTVLGASVFVTNAATAAAGSARDSVTQLSLVTGQRVRTVTNMTNSGYGFDAPRGIASDGINVWEINAKGNTVDQLAGSNLAFLSGTATNLSDPGVVLATTAAVFVSSSGEYSMVTQFTGTGGTLSSPWMMCNSNGPYKFAAPSGFAISGTSLWVTNAANGMVDQMSASTGALIATYG